MAALTPLEIINIGKISIYLAFLDVQRSGLMGARLDPRLPIMLAMETDSVEWRYNLDNTDSTLIDTANYLYSICGKYALRARSIVADGCALPNISPVVTEQYQYTSLPFTAVLVDDGTNPVEGSFTFSHPWFVNAQMLTHIIVNDFTETIEYGDFTFNVASGVITRVNPWMVGDKLVVPFLRKLT